MTTLPTDKKFPNPIEELIEKEQYIRSLPAKKRRIVETYIRTMSIEKTAKALKMSPNRVYFYMQQDDVKLAIQYAQDIISIRNGITIDYFIEKLKEIIDNKEGKVGERIQALHLLAKITGHIKESPANTQQNLVIVKAEGLLDKD